MKTTDLVSYRYSRNDDRQYRWELCDKGTGVAFAQSTRYWYAKEDCIANCHYWTKKLGFVLLDDEGNTA